MNRHLALLLVLPFAFQPVFAVEINAPVESARPSAGFVPNFQLTPPQIDAGYAAARLDVEAALSRIAAVPEGQASFANTIKAFETATSILNDRVQPMVFLAYVSPDKVVREKAQKLEEEYGKYVVNLMLREDVYNAIKAYAAKGETLGGEDKRLLDETLKSFDRNGMSLPADKRAEFKQIQERLAVISSQFEANIGEDKGAIEATREELAGMPQAFVDSLKVKENGKYELTLKYPHVRPVMAQAKSEALRKRMSLAFNERALANMPLLQETLALRNQTARLMGRKDFPTFALENRMAQTPEAVWKFLNDLLPLLREKGRQELQELLAEKKRDDPGATQVNSWDAKYYSTKIRDAKFGFSDEEVRQYFPVDKVVAGTLSVYQKVLGVKFTEVPNEGAWHQSVRLFRIEDAATGRKIGHFFLDLYPREGKFSHAAAFPLIAGRELENGYNEPLAAMVANFSPSENGRPALLKWEEVNTFFHEFGHIMHQTLTTARYASFSGSSVARDFVEAPSQMMENFIWEPEVVAELSDKWDEPGKKLPAELFARMKAASNGYEDGSNLMKGLHYLRQLSFAIIDMVYHSAVPQQTTTMYHELSELITMQASQRDSHPEASFGHLQGYGAGYYSYLWAEVFAEDIFSIFKKEGVFSDVGRRYRRAILERGSSRPEMESLEDFLGRKPNPEAFMRKLNGEPEAPKPAALTREALEGAKRDGHPAPLTGLDDPRLKNPQALVEDGWRQEGAPQADVVHYRYPQLGKPIQEYTTDIYGERSHESLTTRWTEDGRAWSETVSRGADNSMQRATASRETTRAAGTVSDDFAAAARRQGLSEPLTGFADKRIFVPDALLESGWVKEGSLVEFYRYAVGDKTIQLYGRSHVDGAQVIMTVDHAAGLREALVRRADGTFERRTGPAALEAVKSLMPAPKPEAAPPVALWGVVERKKGQPDVAAQADSIVSAHDWSTGWLWWKRKFTTYMVQVSPEEMKKFEAAGFQPIKQLNVVLRWTHVADMNGWGTGVNGSVRGSFTQDLQFPVDKLEDAFKLLEDFEKNPEAVLSRYPENEKWLREKLPQAWDRGYVIDSAIEILTGQKASKTERLLYRGGSRSGYYR